MLTSLVAVGALLWQIFPTINTESLTIQQLAVLLVIQSLFTLVALGVGVGCIKKKNTTLIQYIRERRQRKGRGPTKYVFYGFLLYLLITGVLAYLTSHRGVTIPGLNGEQSLVTMFQSLSGEPRVNYLILGSIVVVLGPLIEEMVYRTYITNALLRYHPALGIVVGAAIFAAVHVEWAVFFNLFIVGLLLGRQYVKTRSGWYPLIFHMFLNATSLLMLLLANHYGWSSTIVG